MSEHSPKRNPFESGNANVRQSLRLIGPAVLVVGVLFTLVGMGSFFSSFGTFEPPRNFWCAFVGLPLIAFGAAITMFAFLGAFVRYQAGEVAPVAKDTFNYLANGTSEGVKTLASAATSGIVDGLSQSGADEIACSKCGHLNLARASYCDECGNRLMEADLRECAKCGESNDYDAKFCNNCGSQLQPAS